MLSFLFPWFRQVDAAQDKNDRNDKGNGKLDVRANDRCLKISCHLCQWRIAGQFLSPDLFFDPDLAQAFCGN